MCNAVIKHLFYVGIFIRDLSPYSIKILAILSRFLSAAICKALNPSWVVKRASAWHWGSGSVNNYLTIFSSPIVVYAIRSSFARSFFYQNRSQIFETFGFDSITKFLLLPSVYVIPSSLVKQLLLYPRMSNRELLYLSMHSSILAVLEE